MLPCLCGKFQLNPMSLSLQEPLNEQLTWVSPNTQCPNFNPAVGICFWLLLEMGHWLHEPLLWTHTALYLCQNLPVQRVSVEAPASILLGLCHGVLCVSNCSGSSRMCDTKGAHLPVQ